MVNSDELLSLEAFRIKHDAYFSDKGIVFVAEQINPSSSSLTSMDRVVAIRVQNAVSEVLLRYLQKGAVFYISYEARFISRSSWDSINEVLIVDFLLPFQPNGKQLISYIEKNTRCKGIGSHKSRVLWSSFGENLYEILEEKDSSRIEPLLTKPTAENLTNCWFCSKMIKGIHFCLTELELNIAITYELCSVYADELVEKLEEDPFRLIAFGLDFSKCDKLAAKLWGAKFNYSLNTRITGAIEYCLIDSNRKSKPAISLNDLTTRVNELFSTEYIPEKDVAKIASCNPNRLQMLEGRLVQGYGTFLQESVIVYKISELIRKANALSKDELHKLPKLDVPYSDEQKNVITKCLQSGVCLLNGPDGTGKAELIRGLYRSLEQIGYVPVLLAPTGKGANKLANSSDKEARTVARYLDSKSLDKFDKLVLIIDESSMLDYLSMCNILIRKQNIDKLILVGDENQLPAPRNSAIFFQLLYCKDVPRVKFSKIHKESCESNMSYAAQAILSSENVDIKCKEVTTENFTTDTMLKKRVVELTSDSRNLEIQVLCPTDREVGILSQSLLASKKGGEIFYKSLDTFKKVNSKLRGGDRVICSAKVNDQNVPKGATGVISKQYQRIKRVFLLSNQQVDSYGQLTCDDGSVYELTSKVMCVLKLGNLTTIHDSQGSQYQQVVVAILKESYITRRMLYTAVTRATKSVIILSSNGSLEEVVQSDEDNEVINTLNYKLSNALNIKTSTDRDPIIIS